MEIATLPSRQTQDLVTRLLDGDRAALARVLTQVENSTPAGRQALDALFSHTGQAHRIGITGAPGTGKSSLVNQLAIHFRRDIAQKRVAIIAVDPSSPFTGGAVLGDRVRMRDLVGDPGVFIRSTASRGAVGGLAVTTAALTQIFDAAGFDAIIIETVGAGQSEVDVARLAHTTVVVEAPGLGDDIQAIKAGILEIADILVVNKADRPGADNTRRALQAMLEMAHPAARLYIDRNCPPEDVSTPQPSASSETAWIPPVVMTIANLANGVESLYKTIQDHREYLIKSGDWDRREQARITTELGNLLQATLMERWQKTVSAAEYHQVVDDLQKRSLSPQQAVEQLLRNTEKAWDRTTLELE